MNPVLKNIRNWYLYKPIALRIFLGIVILPTLISAIYYGFIESDIYISEAKYALRSSDQSSVPSDLLGSILSGGGAGSSREDAVIVRDYILSNEMLEKLDVRLGLREHYESGNVDSFSRLDPDASNEDFLKYYRKMTGVNVDSISNITTIRVKAYDPEKAKNIAKAIIELSEDLVNRLSERIVQDTLKFAKNEVDDAEDRVRKASEAVAKFRSQTQTIDPSEETAAVLKIVTGLEVQLADARAKLTEAKSFMQDDSANVKMLRNKVKALEEQVSDERNRLASGESSVDYTRLLDEYQPLILEQELARQRYKSTLTSLELAKAEAQRKQHYLLSFVPPNTPDEATEPERIKSILTFFVALCIIYALGGLIWAAIKDHMRI